MWFYLVVCLAAGLPVLSAETLRDVTLRQQILTLYPRPLPPVSAVVAPWYNPPTPAKIALGKSLFFDPYLSRCGTVACASCHQPQHGYASPQPVPSGCQGQTGRRRAPSLYNVAYRNHLFWDGRVQSLEQQALIPVASPTEMDNTWTAVLAYLQTGRHEPTDTSHAERRAPYGERFAEVFNGDITPESVSQALAAYERTLITRDAPFDRWLAGDDAALTPLQKSGMALFFGRGNCSVCHPPPLFTDDAFHNIAVPQAGFEKPEHFPYNARIRAAAAAQGWSVPLDVDLGRQEVAALQSSSHALGAFNTPSLRNVTLYRPYMHNGALGTLEAVMQHYELLAAGERRPLVGELAFYVRYRKAFFGARGGGRAEDLPAMMAFMQALQGTTHDDAAED
jgi:cytochrome c peroxidase